MALKILTVLGARPQFVKAAAVSREIATRSNVQEVILHTGQHFDANMSDVFFEELEIPKPDYNLGINSLTHGAMTGRMLEEIEKILLEEKPDVLMVYGDTNSTIAGALAAKKMHIRVAHVEAGLRSFNMAMPEEINRILTDRISDYLFCPTEVAVRNLNNEGFENIDCAIFRNGDVMQDAALYYSQHSAEKSTVADALELDRFVLCTVHRQENTDDPDRLKSIVNALNRIHQEVPVVLPLHPRTRGKLEQHGLKLDVKIIDSVGYFDMIELLKRSELVMTDSGGLQKEAFFFQSNCVTMRDQTEWVELVEHGVNMLTGADEEKIVEAFQTMSKRESDFTVDLYGNGAASARMIDFLLESA